jgi:uncharacterized protein
LKNRLRERAFGLLMAATLLSAVAGSVQADFNAGVAAYEKGNYKAAFDEWLPLAQNNDPAAMRNIGHIYRRGLGVGQDYKKAMTWYKRAATLGFDRAQANVADMYLKGEGVPQDYSQAVQWFARAAQQGHVLSQYNLGLLLENGLGVDKNETMALGWYEAAASAGYPLAIEKVADLKSRSQVAVADVKNSEPVTKSEIEDESEKASSSMTPDSQATLDERDQTQKVASVVTATAVAGTAAATAAKSGQEKSSTVKPKADSPQPVQKKGFYDALKSLSKQKPAAKATAVAAPVVVAKQKSESSSPITDEKADQEMKIVVTATSAAAATKSPADLTEKSTETSIPVPRQLPVPETTEKPVVATQTAALSKAPVTSTVSGQTGLTLEEKLEMADLAYLLKEYQQSLSIWATLAQQDNAEAQYRLGNLFYNGHAVPIDRVRAYYWWDKAKENGSEEAGTALTELEKSLTHMELRQIQRSD